MYLGGMPSTRKRVQVLLPDELLQQLVQLAMDRKLTLSTLCSELIKKQLEAEREQVHPTDAQLFKWGLAAQIEDEDYDKEYKTKLIKLMELADRLEGFDFL